LLLGVDWGHVPLYEKVVDGRNISHPHGWRVKSNTGMAAVVPAWRLNDLLNIKELVMQREKDDKELLERKQAEDAESPVVLDTAMEGEITTEGFHDALKKAGRKISSPDE